MSAKSLKMFYKPFTETLNAFQPHDHICLIYESLREWSNVVIQFLLRGLNRGEKCIYIKNAPISSNIDNFIKSKEENLTEARNQNNLSIVYINKKYMTEFDIDWMIAYLIGETNKAINEGYSALRVTCEMNWAICKQKKFNILLEYEEKLNKEFFPKYPCLSLCQYENRKFPPEFIKEVTMAHPFSIQRNCVSLNILYTILNPKINKKDKS